jgi:ketosteroid isomerase-like protein
MTDSYKATRRRLMAGTLAAVSGVMLRPRRVTAAQGAADDVEQTLQRFLVPFSNRDVAAFSIFFADDATVFFPGRHPRRVEGRANIARAFTELFGPPVSPPGSATLIQPQDLMVQRFDGVAIATFHLGTDAARSRRTFVMRRIGPDWRIAHLHASNLVPNPGK